VYALMRRAQDVVYERTGIWLRQEIELLGRWTPEERAALQASFGLDGGGATLSERECSPRVGVSSGTEVSREY